jgi:thymidylate synthase
MGPLITLSQSAHIYDDCHHYVEKVVEEQYKKICRDRQYDDPCGNFLIEVKEGAIIVEQTTSGSGEAVEQYEGSDPLHLIRRICAANPGIQPEHSAYLGMELQKAKQMLGKYVQDRQ